MSNPVAGVAIAFLSVLLILGISNPFPVLVTSSMALALAALPVVLIATDWEKDCCVQIAQRTVVNKITYFMVKRFHQIYNFLGARKIPRSWYLSESFGCRLKGEICKFMIDFSS